MIGRFSSKPSVIGLDIGRSSIKAAQLSHGPKGPRLDGLLQMRRVGHGAALGEKEAGGLIRAMRRSGMGSSRVALVAASDAVISSSVAVPPPDGKASREAIVKMELSRAHRLSPDSFEYVWWDLPANASGVSTKQAHAIALPHATIGPTLDALDGFDIEVVRTVPASLALLAAAQRRQIDPRRIVAVMDLGQNAARLSLLHAGRVVHERNLPEFDNAAIQSQLQQALGIQPDVSQFALGHYGLRDEPVGAVAEQTTTLIADALDDLTEQVAMSFAFVSHLYPHAEIGPLLLTGGGGNIPGLTNALSRELELETAVMSPTNLLSCEAFGQLMNDPVLSAAIGAALVTEEAS